MPWTVENPPRPAENWPQEEKVACVRAANAALADGKEDAEAIRACLGAAAQVRKKKQDSSYPQGKGATMENTRVIDLFMADKVLAGEPVRILPISTDGEAFWRWGRELEITPEIAAALVANFEKRASVGAHQTNLPLNIEHVDTQGKIGIYESVVLQEDGVYATFDLTEKGRKLLEDGDFDYLSPEIIFDMVDTHTGEDVGPYFVGCAVTNYPFFGDATAMFSREAGEHFEEAGPGPAEGGWLSQSSLFNLVKQAISAAMGTNVPGEVLETTMEGDTMGANNSEPTDGQLQIPEEFTNRMAQLESQAETFRAAIEERDARIEAQQGQIEAQEGQIAELNVSRLRERFSRQADGLPHVGAEREGLVDELVWLHGADTSEGQQHFTYWSNVLSTMEKAMADSEAFRSAGSPGHSQTAGVSPLSQFDKLVAAAAEEQGIVAKKGDANYARLAMEVAEANPDLYTRHVNQVRG